VVPAPLTAYERARDARVAHNAAVLAAMVPPALALRVSPRKHCKQEQR
jgi:hypothetical protein